MSGRRTEQGVLWLVIRDGVPKHFPLRMLTYTTQRQILLIALALIFNIFSITLNSKQCTCPLMTRVKCEGKCLSSRINVLKPTFTIS